MDLEVTTKIFVIMRKLYTTLSLLALTAFGAVSCVADYDLENINTEITLGGDGLTAPLGYIEKVTLDSLLKETGDIIQQEPNGDLKVAMDSSITFTVDAINIDPIEDVIPELEPIHAYLSDKNVAFPEGFSLPEQTYAYEVEVPTYTINNDAAKLPEFRCDIVPSLGVKEFVEGVTIPADFVAPITAEGTEVVDLHFECPDEVSRINKVWFADKGAHISVTFDLGSLSSLAANNRINSLNVTLPDYYYLELNDDMNGAATLTNGHILTINNHDLGDKTSFSLSAYLVSVDMSKLDPVEKDGKRVIEYADNLTYSLDYQITTKSGTVSFATTPSMHIVIDNALFGDAEVVSNAIELDPIVAEQDLSYRLNGLSPDIYTIRHIAFSDKSDIRLIVGDLGLPIEGWDDCKIVIELPDCFQLDAERLSSAATLNSEGHILTTTIGALVKGLQLPVSAIDFGQEGVPVKVEDIGDGKRNGFVEINDHLSVSVYPVFPSATYMLSEITEAMGTHQLAVRLSATNLYIIPEESNFIINEISNDINFSEKIEFDINDVPAELVSVERISMTDAEGEIVDLAIEFSLSDAPVSHIILRDIKISLPQCLWIEGENIDENNVMTISERSVDLAAEKRIHLTTIRVLGVKNMSVTDGQIAIRDSVSINGRVSIPKGEIMSGVTEDIIITPYIELPALYARQFSGRVDVQLDKYVTPQVIDLSEFTEALGDAEIEITEGLVAPVINLDVSNPIGAAVEGTLHLTAYYIDDSVLPLEVDLHVNAAEGDQAGVTKICITDDAANAPAGYTAITPEGYAEIFHNIPSRLEVSVTGGVGTDQVCTLPLGCDYVFDLSYSLSMPLALRGEVTYAGKFGGLAGTFNEIADLGIQINELGLVIYATSSLPVDVYVDMTPLNAEGNPVEGLQTNVDGCIKGCAAQGAAQESKLAVSFSGSVAVLADVDALAYSLRLAAMPGSVAQLNANQSVSARVIVKAEKGLTLDIKDFLEEESDDDDDDYTDGDDYYEE